VGQDGGWVPGTLVRIATAWGFYFFFFFHSVYALVMVHLTFTQVGAMLGRQLALFGIIQLGYLTFLQHGREQYFD
jgi:hypothetical protein